MIPRLRESEVQIPPGAILHLDNWFTVPIEVRVA